MIPLERIIDDLEGEIKTVYYPGAFTDFSILELFWHVVKNDEKRHIIYSDYGLIGQHEDPFPAINGALDYFLPDAHSIPLVPDHYDRLGWSDFWYPHPSSHQFGNPSTAFALEWSNGYRTFSYFGSEGIQTCIVLIDNNIFPDLIVLQDHGFGGNWTEYCNPARELYSALSTKGHLPKYLICDAERYPSAGPWPGYERISAPFTAHMYPPQHKNARALYMNRDTSRP